NARVLAGLETKDREPRMGASRLCRARWAHRRGSSMSPAVAIRASACCGAALRSLPQQSPCRRFLPPMPATSPGPMSRIFFSQRLRRHYVAWGNAGAAPLLLVHGGRDHCRNWDWLAEKLGREWHIIAPDLRGHGDSQWSQDGSYMMAGYVYDLA